jgi:hypothetical protein
MHGLIVGPYSVRVTESWHYASPQNGIPVGSSVEIAPAAGPGRRRILVASQFCSQGEGLVEVIIKTGSLVLFRFPLFFTGSATAAEFPIALRSAENEALTLDVGGSDGALFFNAQGYTAR